jgi:hypothetical protein
MARHPHVRITRISPPVPDAPITDFQLNLKGGPGGYLVNNSDVCGHPAKRHGRKRFVHTKQTSDALFTAHNADTLTTQVPLSAPCGKGKKSKKSNRHARHKRH